MYMPEVELWPSEITCLWQTPGRISVCTVWTECNRYCCSFFNGLLLVLCVCLFVFVYAPTSHREHTCYRIICIYHWNISVQCIGLSSMFCYTVFKFFFFFQMHDHKRQEFFTCNFFFYSMHEEIGLFCNDEINMPLFGLTVTEGNVPELVFKGESVIFQRHKIKVVMMNVEELLNHTSPTD